MSQKSINFVDGFFQSDLDLLITLEVEGQKAEVISGNIERISLDLHSYGFSGNVQISSYGDQDLDTVFNSTKVLVIVNRVAGITCDPNEST